MRRQTAIIAAMAKNRVIGRQGRIPWDLPEDRAHFRELTVGNVVVMGRRTYEEIGHPLPERMNYLVSSTYHIEGTNCQTVTSLGEVFLREPERKIFICGGAMLYQEALPLAERLYLTELSWEVEGDTLFPQIEEEMFRLADRDDREGGYSFLTYERRR